jgi:sugar phosphate permease
VAVLAPALRDRYELTLGETGLLIASSLLGSTVSLIPWGILADRVGERPVLAVGLGGCGAALLAAGSVERFWHLLALLSVAGCAGASVQSASGRAVMHWFVPSRRGLALGIRQTAIPIGGFAASLVVPHLGPGWGFRTLGIFCLVAAAAGATLLREGPIAGAELGVGAVALRDRRIWVLSGASALILWPQMCLVGFMVLFLHDRRGVATGYAAAALAAVQLLGIGARIGAGAWSDVLRSRLVPLCRIAVALTALTALTAALVRAPLSVLLPVLVLTGGLAMSWNGLAFTAVAELAGTRAGAAIGLQQTVINSAAAAVPPLFGVLVGAGGWAVGFALVALGPLGGLWALRPLAGRA